MRLAHPRLALTLALILPLGACGDDAADEPAGLAGADFDLETTREEAYALGGFEAIDWDAFGNVSGIGFDDAENLYILDSQAASIHVVSTTGERLRSFGQRGEGPGELNSPRSMVVFPDGAVAVYDFSKFGWVTYGPDGEWIEDVTADDPSNIQLLGNFEVAGANAVFAEVVGQIRMASGPSSADDEEDEEPEEEGDPIVRVALESGAEPTTVFRAWEPPPPEGAETELSGTTEGGGNMVFRMSPLRAFEPQLHFAALPDGRFAALDSTTYRVEIFDAQGTFERAIERPIPPVQVTSAIEAAERDRRIAEHDEQQRNGSGGGGMRVITLGGAVGGGAAQMDGMADAMRERIENMLFFAEIPAIEALAADRQGRLWIQRSSGEPGEPGPTDIVRADGTYVGTIPADGLRIPDAFGPNGLVAWIETDEFDAERVVVARIQLGGTS